MCIMRHENASHKPLMNFLCHIFKCGGIAHHRSVYARKTGDEIGNFPARIDQCMKHVRDPAAVVVVNSDFSDTVVVRVAAGSFNINNCIHGKGEISV